MYPNKKQIKRKTEDLIRSLYYYHLGLCPAHMVLNEFKCLFTDVGLDILHNHEKEPLVNGNFEQMIHQFTNENPQIKKYFKEHGEQKI